MPCHITGEVKVLWSLWRICEGLNVKGQQSKRVRREGIAAQGMSKKASLFHKHLDVVT